MADGGQRLLDVIDDPNALETFLGSLTSDDLLHSSNVNNVVEHLTGSLVGEYDIDSPSDTLFDTLESSANLTDISQSTVPFDFGGDHHGLDPYSISSVGIPTQNVSSSSGTGQFDLSSCATTNEQMHHLQMQQHYSSTTSNTCDSSSVSSFNILSSSNLNNNTLSNTSNSNFITSNMAGDSSSNSVLYSSATSSESYLSQHHQQTVSASGHGQAHLEQQQQLHMSSLSSASMVLSQSHSSAASVIPGGVISSNSGPTNLNQNQSQVALNGALSFQEQSKSESGSSEVPKQHPQGDAKSEIPAHQTGSTIQLQLTSTTDSAGTTTISATSAPQHQTITAAQFTNLSLSQLVQQAQQQAQAVLTPQIINTGTGLQLQTAQQPSFFIDSNGQLVAAAGGATGTPSFSTSNLALVATAGGVQQYAVVAQPSAQQLFSANAITMQPQTTTIQSIKNPNGSTTYFQTNTPQIIGTSHLQTTTSASPGSGMTSNLQSSIIRPKPPPQLLPKPSTTATKSTPTSSVSKPGTPSGGAVSNLENSNLSSHEGGICISNVSTGTTSNPLGAVVTSNNVIGSTTTTTAGSVVTSLATSMSTNSISIDALGQFLQQHGQQGISTGGLTFTQPSFAIGPNGVVVSGVNNLNAMAGTPQTLILNQMGQQMIVPTAQGGFQILLRQQPSQPQLVIQSPSIGAQGAATAKPIIRYVTQNSLQMQQPQFIIRTMPSQIQTQTQSQSQPQQIPSSVSTTTPVTQTVEPRKPAPASTPQQPQVQKQFRHATPISSINNNSNTKSQPSPEPPKKKAKQTKKKVTIDLNDLFKKAGIDSGDFEDDGFDFFGLSEASSTPNGVQDQSTLFQSNKMNGSTNNNTISTPSFHALPHVRVLEPVDKTKQRKTPPKGKGKMQALPPIAPPPVVLPAPPKPVMGKDGKIIYLEPPIINLDVPIPPDTNATKLKKSAAKGKSKKLVEPEPEPPRIPSPPPTKKKKYYPKKKEPLPTTHSITNTINLKPLGPPPIIPLMSGPPRPIVTSTSVITPPAVVTTSPPGATTNVQPSVTPRVHTLSLSPQNQQLLRNIQIQINRLVALPSRNETEETALQKLRVLQQQVIATGITLPNPPQVQTSSTSPGLVPTLGNGISVLNASTSSVSSSGASSISSPITTFANTTGNMTSSSTTATQHSLLNNKSSNRPNFLLPQSRPLILNNATTPSPAQSGIADSGQGAPAESNRSILAVTTDPTTKKAYIISLANKSGLSSTAICNSSSDAPAISVDKVTSATGTTTTTTTISTTNGGARQYQYQYQTQPQQAPAVLLRDLAEDKKSEELRLAKLKEEEEAKTKWRKEQFDSRYQKDQEIFLDPDYKTPFKSMDDAMERLSSFHIARERREMEFEEFDHDFSETACHLIDKFHGMVAKYRALVLRESMREVSCCEHVMVERIFVGEERASLEQDRSLVAEGEILELPPPPQSWIPQIEEYVETELKEMERDSIVNLQVQSAVDSIITFGNNDSSNYALPEESDKIEVDAFGVPISSSGYSNGINSSSADIDEAVRSILI